MNDMNDARGTLGTQKATFAMGCFWGVEETFVKVPGVISTQVGYTGGKIPDPGYHRVCDGDTGHAEAVEVTYDPAKVSYGQLLKVFFAVAHDPTELNRQGPDTGTQYRSVVFFSNAEQEHIAQAYINQLNRAQVFRRQIVTQLVVLDSFYEAESYHQDYATHHPDEPYIYINDLPKVANLRKELNGLYVARVVAR